MSEQASYALIALGSERRGEWFAKCAEELEGGPYTAILVGEADEALAFINQLCESEKAGHLILLVTDKTCGDAILERLSKTEELSRTPTVIVSKAHEQQLAHLFHHGLPSSVLRTTSKKEFRTAVSAAVRRRRERR